MRRPDVRATVIEAVLAGAARAGVDDVALIAAIGLNRRMTPAELQRLLGERVFRSFHADGLLRNHDAEDADELTALDGGPGDRGRRQRPGRRLRPGDLRARGRGSAPVRRARIARRARLGGHLLAASGAVSEAVRRGRRTRRPGRRRSTPLCRCSRSTWCSTTTSSRPAWRSWASASGSGASATRSRWRGLRRGLAVAPVRLRRRILDRFAGHLGTPTAVFAGRPGGGRAGQPGAASATSSGWRCRPGRRRRPRASASTPRTAWMLRSTRCSPPGRAWSACSAATPARGLVRDGGAVIIFHPMPNDFSPLHHPSYVDFFADVLPRTTDPDADPGRLRAEVRHRPLVRPPLPDQPGLPRRAPVAPLVRDRGGQAALRRRGLGRSRPRRSSTGSASGPPPPWPMRWRSSRPRSGARRRSATCTRRRRSWWTSRDAESTDAGTRVLAPARARPPRVSVLLRSRLHPGRPRRRRARRPDASRRMVVANYASPADPALVLLSLARVLAARRSAVIAARRDFALVAARAADRADGR